MLQDNNLKKSIGNTPLVSIKMFDETKIYGKLEFLNLGGSIKSRTAYWMIKRAYEEGRIDEDTVLVEASSGNQGIGIAMVGGHFDLKVKIIMPENMSRERRQLIKTYGAEVILTSPGDDIKEAIDNAIDKAQELITEKDNHFWLNQFANQHNTEVHRLCTSQEIIEQLREPVDYFVAGIGTGGTLTGVGLELKEKFPECQVIAVEPENAAILNGGKMCHHIQQGIGDGLIPDILDTSLIDDTIIVSDSDARNTACYLSKNGYFTGFSSGSNAFGAWKIAKDNPDSTVVTVLPDGGERYLTENIVKPKKLWCENNWHRKIKI